MKAASNKILIYADNEILSTLLNEEFTQVDIELFAAGHNPPEDAAHSNEVIVLDQPDSVAINDERLPKPFLVTSLIKAINSQLTKNRSSGYLIDDYEFFPALNIVTRKGDVITLTDKESQLLAYLVRAGGYVHKNELLQQIWGYKNEVDTKTLDTHIYKLKQKLPLLREMIIRHKFDYKICLP